MSLDIKLMLIYHISMMVLFGTHIIKNAASQAIFALVLFVVLVIISIVHKFWVQWKWPGAGIKDFASAILSIAFVYAFFSFAAYTIRPNFEFPNLQDISYIGLILESWNVIIAAASVPVITPWYLAGIGIGLFNLLSSLKLVTSKKSEFEAQCINS